MKISIRNATVKFNMHDHKSRSLRNRLCSIATGGKFDQTNHGKITVTSLNNISFDASSGDRVALIGHNGAGKSTFLRMLSGIYRPILGSVDVNGSVRTLLDISLGIEPEATGIENILLRAALLGIPKKIVKDKLDEIIEFTELGDFIDLPVRTYSSGMQVRLAFAVSTIGNPDILLMDEWLSVGDERFASKAEKRLNEFIDQSGILILATHSKRLAESVCNKAVLFEHGKIIESGSVSDVWDLYASRS